MILELLLYLDKFSCFVVIIELVPRDVVDSNLIKIWCQKCPFMLNVSLNCGLIVIFLFRDISVSNHRFTDCAHGQ